MVDDRDLVVAAGRGDAGAFRTLVRNHERSMHATSCAILGAGWDATDAVQDALETAWSKLSTLREPSAFSAWLSRILVNRCNATLRSRNRRQEVLCDDVPETSRVDAYEIVGSEARLDLLSALMGLDLEQRQVVALRYFRDLKVADIARMLDCPEGTVKSRLNRAIGRLGSVLGDDSRTEVSR